MIIDLNKIPEEIPAIWVLAMALIHMNPDVESHFPIIQDQLGLSWPQADTLTCRLKWRGMLTRKPGTAYESALFTLTPEGHRLLDRIEAGCPIG